MINSPGPKDTSEAGRIFAWLRANGSQTITATMEKFGISEKKDQAHLRFWGPPRKMLELVNGKLTLMD